MIAKYLLFRVKNIHFIISMDTIVDPQSVHQKGSEIWPEMCLAITQCAEDVDCRQSAEKLEEQQ